MSRKATLTGLLLAACLLASGCTTHRRLRQNTIDQSETVSDIYTQQVLDNLAMFVYDSNSLPFFAFPDKGSNTVTDTGEASVTPNWVAAAFEKIGLSAKASRSMAQNWTTTPIRDPHKLALMRCAYQHALAGHIDNPVSDECPQCDGILKDFYRGNDHKDGIDVDCLKKWRKDTNWLGIGCKKDVPKNCGCELVGHYCGQYVWVLPGYRDKLTQLTLAVLDYALFEKPKPAQDQVVDTYETVVDKESGKPVLRLKSRKVTFNQDHVKRDSEGNRIRDKMGKIVDKTYLPRERTQREDSSILRLRQDLNTLPR